MGGIVSQPKSDVEAVVRRITATVVPRENGVAQSLKTSQFFELIIGCTVVMRQDHLPVSCAGNLANAFRG
jgi:hypothetical protein